MSIIVAVNDKAAAQTASKHIAAARNILAQSDSEVILTAERFLQKAQQLLSLLACDSQTTTVTLPEGDVDLDTSTCPAEVDGREEPTPNIDERVRQIRNWIDAGFTIEELRDCLDSLENCENVSRRQQDAVEKIMVALPEWKEEPRRVPPPGCEDESMRLFNNVSLHVSHPCSYVDTGLSITILLDKMGLNNIDAETTTDIEARKRVGLPVILDLLKQTIPVLEAIIEACDGER